MNHPYQMKLFPILDWTPEQALAAYELLANLMDIVWDVHQEAIVELWRHQSNDGSESETDIAEGDHDFDDDIPF